MSWLWITIVVIGILAGAGIYMYRRKMEE
jgi:LPXTG-motif cell wall-anchored protein